MRCRTECATSSCCSSERAFHQSRNSSVNSTSHATPIVCHIRNTPLSRTLRRGLRVCPLGRNALSHRPRPPGGRNSRAGSFERYVSRSIAGSSRRTILPWRIRLPVTSAGWGIVVQQREQMSISPARPVACSRRIRCISPEFQVAKQRPRFEVAQGRSIQHIALAARIPSLRPQGASIPGARGPVPGAPSSLPTSRTA